MDSGGRRLAGCNGRLDLTPAPSDWNERLAEFMANKENIQLAPDHREVINYLRKFYFRYGITPMVRLQIKHMGQEKGEKKFSHD